jgi:L,D-transpeptidase catalytic domain
MNVPGIASTWAYITKPVKARSDPSPDAPAVARLTTRTEDRTSELVAVFQQATDDKGHTWYRADLPVRPNGTEGWIPESALGTLHVVHTWLQVDLRLMRARLIRGGRRVFSAPVGIGKPGTPTPMGTFYIRDRLDKFPTGSIYGALAFGTSAHSDTLTDWPKGGVVGIHGTNEPNLIPGRISHGCIRMTDTNIRRLDKLMPIGTPVTIS